MSYKLNKSEIAYRKIGDEFFVLTTRDSFLHSVAGAGARIMELLDAGKDEGEILRTLVAEYDAPEAEIKADLAAFLAELEEKGIASSNGS
jgi:hypothetical protein